MVLGLVQEVFPFIEELVNVEKGYPVFPQELSDILERLYPGEPSMQFEWDTQVHIPVHTPCILQSNDIH